MTRSSCSALLFIAFQPVNREEKWIPATYKLLSSISGREDLHLFTPQSLGDSISYVSGDARIALLCMPALWEKAE